MNCLHLNRCQPLTGDDYALLRQNPDRGFRLAVSYTHLTLPTILLV